MTEANNSISDSENIPLQERITDLVSALETLDAEGLLSKEVLDKAQHKIDVLKNLYFKDAHRTIQGLREKFRVTTHEVVSKPSEPTKAEIQSVDVRIPPELSRELSKIEEKILETLIQSNDREYYTSPKAIVKAVWGDEISGEATPAKLRTPMYRLRQKLEEFRFGKIEFKVDKGYRFIRN